jgi:hypothetical protein
MRVERNRQNSSVEMPTMTARPALIFVAAHRAFLDTECRVKNDASHTKQTKPDTLTRHSWQRLVRKPFHDFGEVFQPFGAAKIYPQIFPNEYLTQRASIYSIGRLSLPPSSWPGSTCSLTIG